MHKIKGIFYLLFVHIIQPVYIIQIVIFKICYCADGFRRNKILDISSKIRFSKMSTVLKVTCLSHKHIANLLKNGRFQLNNN